MTAPAIPRDVVRMILTRRRTGKWRWVSYGVIRAAALCMAVWSAPHEPRACIPAVDLRPAGRTWPAAAAAHSAAAHQLRAGHRGRAVPVARESPGCRRAPAGRAGYLDAVPVCGARGEPRDAAAGSGAPVDLSSDARVRRGRLRVAGLALPAPGL